MIRLYQRTSVEAAAAILAEGFRDGEDGVVWFAPHLDAMGEAARGAVIEVVIDLSEDERQAFSRSITTEVLDDVSGDWIPSDPDEWFAIPAAVLNSRGRARNVPLREIPFLEF